MSLGSFKDHGQTAFATASSELQSRWNRSTEATSKQAREMVASKDVHLCVLIHGLWGNPSHLNYLATSMREAYPEDKVHILLTTSNANSYTYDGIDLGGERTANEIEGHIEELSAQGITITKISITGYSLGGLVARYVVGLLYSKGVFVDIQPVNFTTFATPHLGVRSPLLGPHNYIFNVLGPKTLSKSGRQLWAVDSFRDTNRPLLSILADKDSIFSQGLASFKRRTLYSNITNDRSVNFYTSCISSKDPYTDLSAVKLNFLSTDNNVLLDPTRPVTPKPRAPLGFWARLRSSSLDTLTTIPFYFLLAVLIPIGSVLFLLNSGYQTIRSAQRVKLHESGGAGFSLDHYRIPFIEETRNLSDRVYSRLNDHQGEDYLPGEPSKSSASTSTSATVSEGEEETPVRSSKFKGQESFPTLALTKEQFDMIEGLDSLGWTKYPVNIRAVRHTHAAIIVRTRPSAFYEGKIVVGHWIENFEV